MGCGIIFASVFPLDGCSSRALFADTVALTVHALALLHTRGPKKMVLGKSIMSCLLAVCGVCIYWATVGLLADNNVAGAPPKREFRGSVLLQGDRAVQTKSAHTGDRHEQPTPDYLSAFGGLGLTVYSWHRGLAMLMGVGLQLVVDNLSRFWVGGGINAARYGKAPLGPGSSALGTARAARGALGPETSKADQQAVRSLSALGLQRGHLLDKNVAHESATNSPMSLEECVGRGCQPRAGGSQKVVVTDGPADPSFTSGRILGFQGRRSLGKVVFDPSADTSFNHNDGNAVRDHVMQTVVDFQRRAVSADPDQIVRQSHANPILSPNAGASLLGLQRTLTMEKGSAIRDGSSDDVGANSDPDDTLQQDPDQQRHNLALRPNEGASLLGLQIKHTMKKGSATRDDPSGDGGAKTDLNDALQPPGNSGSLLGFQKMLTMKKGAAARDIPSDCADDTRDLDNVLPQPGPDGSLLGLQRGLLTKKTASIQAARVVGMSDALHSLSETSVQVSPNDLKKQVHGNSVDLMQRPSGKDVVEPREVGDIVGAESHPSNIMQQGHEAQLWLQLGVSLTTVRASDVAAPAEKSAQSIEASSAANPNVAMEDGRKDSMLEHEGTLFRPPSSAGQLVHRVG